MSYINNFKYEKGSTHTSECNHHDNWPNKLPQSFKIPTVKSCQDTPLVVTQDSSNKSEYNSKPSADCFAAVTLQYKNIYVRTAERYLQRLNGSPSADNILDDECQARKILNASANKIEELEQENSNKDLILAVGELAKEFVDLALRYDKTDNLFKLFKEALKRILRTPQNETVQIDPSQSRENWLCNGESELSDDRFKRSWREEPKKRRSSKKSDCNKIEINDRIKIGRLVTDGKMSKGQWCINPEIVDNCSMSSSEGSALRPRGTRFRWEPKV